MPRGISLHVGINKYSSLFPNANDLKGCENDAKAMQKIAEDNGFEKCDLLRGCEATYMRVTTKIRSAAAQLEKGDIFFFSFAGHGFRYGQEAGDSDETDGLDETLLLFDALLFDDVLRKELWPCFKPGVRVLMVADSCHSGTTHQAPPDDSEGDNVTMDDPPVATGGGPIREVEFGAGKRHLEEYRDFYRNTHLPLRAPIHASVLHLPACLDHQTTGDGEENGVFTVALLEVLKNIDEPLGNYDELAARIDAQLPNQSLELQVAGQDFEDFRKQQPFTVKVE